MGSRRSILASAIICARSLRECPTTLEALGHRLGVSRERVRRLELRAKSKLSRLLREASIEDR